MKKTILTIATVAVFTGCAHKAPTYTKISGVTAVVTQKMINDVKKRRAVK
jgi:predicted small lipoprotein YifL